MNKIVSKIIFNKNFLILFCVFSIVIYLIFNPLLMYKVDYANQKNILDSIYLFYVFLLPMSFYDMGFIVCFLLDVCFYSLNIYLIVKCLDYFLVKLSSSVVYKLTRKNLMKKIILYSQIYSLFLSIFYVIFYFVMCVKSDINITITSTLIIAIVLKILLSLISSIIYLFIYIKTRSSFLSLAFSFFSCIIFELFLKMMFDEITLSFRLNYLIIVFLFFIYNITIILAKRCFERWEVL